MAGWSVDFRDGALIINANANFDMMFKKNVNDNGGIESIDYMLTIEGDIVQSTAALVADDFVLYSQEVTNNYNASKVLIKRDGTTEWTWDPAVGIIGPHITEFQSIPDEGNADSHWRYRMTIIYRAKPGTENKEELDEFRTSVATTTIRGRIVRKVWKASGKAKTSAAALNVIKTFKPGNLKDLEQTLEEHPKDSRATGVWIWNAFHRVFCEVTHEGYGKSYVPQPLAGLTRTPLLHRKRNQVGITKVRGFVRGPDPAKLTRPAAHVGESATVVRIEQMETETDGPVIDNEIQGMYRLPFTEVYWSTSGKPKVTHQNSHQIINFDKPPGDAKVGS